MAPQYCFNIKNPSHRDINTIVNTLSDFVSNLDLNNFIKDRFNPDQKIHNTCWGLDICNCHVRFKQLLEKKFGIENVVNSDIKKSNLKNTCLYDVTTKSNYFKEKFDYVVNISAIEEIRFDHLKIIKNLYEQVKKEGYLTFFFIGV